MKRDLIHLDSEYDESDSTQKKKGAKKGLGKGLGSLLGEGAVQAVEHGEDEQRGEVIQVKLTDIEPNADQPRKVFEDEALRSLSQSIKENGLLQPLVVRRNKNGYQIIVGERRWRAARLAGLDMLPVKVIEADDRHVQELALIENLQREDLNPVEEAEGYKFLQDSYGLTQEEIAERVGKSRPTVANMLRLLNLCPTVRELLSDGALSPGHARALLQLREDDQISIAERIIAEGLSVRQVESIAAKRKDSEDESAAVQQVKVDYYKLLQEDLGKKFGRRVIISGGKKKGKIQLEYYGNEDLDTLIEKLSEVLEEKE